MNNKLVVFFFASHAFFAIFLGQMFAFAPDEEGYLFAFNNAYTLPVNTASQSGSGWIVAPTIFLWIVYLPAKILSLIGLPDYLSIRLLSIAMTTLSLYLFLKMSQRIKGKRPILQNLIFLGYFIPSVFFWTSTGLRESFIILELTIFFIGLNCLFVKKEKNGIFLLFVSSYGLLSTKTYLWALLIIALIVFSSFSLILKTQKGSLLKLISACFIAPLLFFSLTSSYNILNYFSSISITDVGLRSGNSVSRVEIEDSENVTKFELDESELDESELVFHGNFTLIQLRSFLVENPDSVFARVFGVFDLDERVESLWSEKIQEGLKSEAKQVGEDKASLNGHILKTGVITEPWSMLWPAFVFLTGPFPLLGEPGIAVSVASFESPFWWCLYAFVIYQFYRFRKFKLFRDPAILFALIFLAGQIAFSSLIEVNLGTSFRHRSILLVPLVFLYVRITQRVHELSSTDSKPKT